jgi:ubiquinone/menaquinone biosynthesis C-methylase UbiE
VHIADGSSIAVDDSSIDAVFSYITLQHCKASDALGLTSEAFRIVKPDGYVALNYRTWVPADWVLLPAGVVMRQLWRIPVVGPRLSQWRWSTRFGWQANRLDPKRVLSMLEASGVDLDDVAILHHPGKPQKPVSYKGTTVVQRDLDVANKSHWWLVARSH